MVKLKCPEVGMFMNIPPPCSTLLGFRKRSGRPHFVTVFNCVCRSTAGGQSPFYQHYKIRPYLVPGSLSHIRLSCVRAQRQVSSWLIAGVLLSRRPLYSLGRCSGLATRHLPPLHPAADCFSRRHLR